MICVVKYTFKGIIYHKNNKQINIVREAYEATQEFLKKQAKLSSRRMRLMIEPDTDSIPSKENNSYYAFGTLIENHLYSSGRLSTHELKIAGLEYSIDEAFENIARNLKIQLAKKDLLLSEKDYFKTEESQFFCPLSVLNKIKYIKELTDYIQEF